VARHVLFIQVSGSFFFDDQQFVDEYDKRFVPCKIDLHASRPHPGQNLVAQRLRALLTSSFYPSAIAQSHVNCGKVQDAYSIRCIPQVECNSTNSIR
jgi:histidine ammonia-lyase